MMIVIGDVHGCYDTLMELIKQFPPNQELCFCGDLIDRGTDSSKVVEFVKSNNHQCALGNHEKMMVDFIADSQGAYGYKDNSWLYSGGNTTLESYGSDKQLDEHVKWMGTLPTILEFPEIVNDKGRHLLVSHSSAARFMAGLAAEEEVLWNRDIAHGTLKSSNNFYNIFGHTVHKTPHIKEGYACIDTGGVFTGFKGYGTLTALQFPEMIVYSQKSIEKDN